MMEAEPMTPLDKRCILALQPATGLPAPARRLVDHLAFELRLGRAIAPARRGALYALAWRHRDQLPLALQVKVALASADAHMRASLDQART